MPRIGEPFSPRATEGGGDTDGRMTRITLSILALMATGASALAASAINNDGEARTLIVTEGGNRAELVVGAGETVDFCPDGCFVTMPNGDREALTGSETIEISGGEGRVR